MPGKTARIFALALATATVPGASLAQEAMSDGTAGIEISFSVDLQDERTTLNGLLGLYLTLHEFDVLPTETVPVDPGQNLVSKMIDLGEWPALLSGGELVLASLLCDLNPGDCERDLVKADDTYEGFQVKGYLPSEPRWKKLNSAGKLVVPKVGLKYGYKPRKVRRASIEKLDSNGFAGLPVEITGDIRRVYCNTTDQCQTQNWQSDEWAGNPRLPEAIVFDPKQSTHHSDEDLEVLADEGDYNAAAVARVLNSDSAFSVMAVPNISGEYQLPLTADDWTAGAGEIVQQRLGDYSTLHGGGLQLESTSGEEHETRKRKRVSVWKNFSDLNDHFQNQISNLAQAIQQGRLTPTAYPTDRQLVIYHLDGWADLSHCHFVLSSDYVDIVVADLDLIRKANGGNVPIKAAQYSTERVEECEQQFEAGTFFSDEEHDDDEYSLDEHGTGTLSTLVGALAYLDALSDNRLDFSTDLKPWLIVHVPLTSKRPETTFTTLGYTEEEKDLSNPDLGLLGAEKVEDFFTALHVEFSTLPPPHLINFSLSLRGVLQARLSNELGKFSEDGYNPILIAAAAKPIVGDSVTPQHTCMRFPVSAKSDNVASVVGTFWESPVSLAPTHPGTVDKTCHTVASLGKVPTPEPSSLNFKYAKGSSFAAPIITAAVAHLIRQGAVKGTLPSDYLLSDKHVDDVIRWIMATSTFHRHDSQFARGGTADLPTIMSFGSGVLEATGGCHISGFDSNFVYLENERSNDWPLVCQSREKEFVNNGKIEALFRTDDGLLWLLLPDKEDLCEGKAHNFVLMQELLNSFENRSLRVRRESYDLPSCQRYYDTETNSYSIPLRDVLRLVNVK